MHLQGPGSGGQHRDIYFHSSRASGVNIFKLPRQVSRSEHVVEHTLHSTRECESTIVLEFADERELVIVACGALV